MADQDETVQEKNLTHQVQRGGVLTKTPVNIPRHLNRNRSKSFERHQPSTSTQHFEGRPRSRSNKDRVTAGRQTDTTEVSIRPSGTERQLISTDHKLHCPSLDEIEDGGSDLIKRRSRSYSCTLHYEEHKEENLITDTDITNRSKAESGDRKKPNSINRFSDRSKHKDVSDQLETGIISTPSDHQATDLSLCGKAHQVLKSISVDSPADCDRNKDVSVNDSPAAPEHLSASTSSAPSDSAKSSNRLRNPPGRISKHDPICWQCGSSTRSVSTMSRSSSDSEEDFVDAELPVEFVMFDEDFDHMYYPDWDSGFSVSDSGSNHSNDIYEDDEDWTLEDELGMLQSLEERQDWNSPTTLLYPHRALRRDECQVCLEMVSLRRRVCCDFKICGECLKTYVAMKVNEAKVQIECPSDRCSTLIPRLEVNDHLSNDMKLKFARFLVNANEDPCKKTCPSCSEVYSIDDLKVISDKKTQKHGLKVFCAQCKLQWCFLCQAPFHTNITCKQFRKGDKMVKKWAKEKSYGQSNAQRCPKCKIFIQKVHGCDHMKCTRCNTNFCYRCGDRYFSIKLLGNHWSKFSPFGCKYRLLPQKPGLRRLIRGANLAARLMGGVVLAGLGLAAGAILVGASVIIVPGYGIFRLRRRLQQRKRWHGFNNQVMRSAALEQMRAERLQDVLGAQMSIVEESEVEVPDTQQVQVMVHRSVSFSHEEPEPVNLQVPMDDEYEFFINKYTAEGTNLVVSATGDDSAEEVIVVTDVKEIPNENGYPTVVANIVSKMAENKEGSGKDKALRKDKGGSSADPTSARRESVDRKIRKAERDKKAQRVKEICKEYVKMLNMERPADEESLPDDRASCSRETLVDLHDDSSVYEAPICNDCMTSSGSTSSGSKPSEMCSEQESSKNTSSDIRQGTDIVNDGTENAKGSSNGCFGNIFSKRNPVLGDDQNLKPQSSEKKVLNHKAATWEKCRRDRVPSLLKSSPLDQVMDLKNFSAKYMDLLNPDIKHSEQTSPTDIKADIKFSQPVIHDGDASCPVKEITLHDACSRILLSQEGTEDNRKELFKGLQTGDFSEDIELSAEPVSGLGTTHGDPAIENNCYISEISYVTYL